MKRGKKYVEAAKNIDRQTLYEAADAISLVKKNATAKFDETIEAHIRTGCDGRHAERLMRLLQLEQISLVARSLFLRSRTITGSSSTLLLQLQI